VRPAYAGTLTPAARYPQVDLTFLEVPMQLPHRQRRSGGSTPAGWRFVSPMRCWPVCASSRSRARRAPPVVS
jgi:hypothetical protein